MRLYSFHLALKQSVYALAIYTFAHVLLCGGLGAYVHDLPFAESRKTSVENTHILPTPLTGRPHQWLPTFDQHCPTLLVMEAYHREPPLVTVASTLEGGD